MEIFILTDNNLINEEKSIKVIKISSIQARDKLIHNNLGIRIIKLPTIIVKLNGRYIFFPYKSLNKLKEAKEPYIEKILIIKKKYNNSAHNNTGISIVKLPYVVIKINGEHGFS